MRKVLALLATLFAFSAQAQQATVSIPSLISNPPVGFNALKNVFTVDFTASLGTVVTLNGLVATQAIAGLLTTDQVLVQAVTALPTGVSVGGAFVSVNGTLSINFATAVIGNVVLGS